MPKPKPHVLDLSIDALREVLQISASDLDKNLAIIEKDLWVSWVLEQLFSMPDARPMAFKGGTSLSKVFGCINRFSEDIDVTLDYRGFGVGEEFDFHNPNLSKSQIGRLGKKLKASVSDYTVNIVEPYLQQRLKTIKLGAECSITLPLDDEGKVGEQICIHYPTVIQGTPEEYITDYVLIEFGGRNIIDPNTGHTVQSEISHMVGDTYITPSQIVTVLSPERTFWEKATLIHVSCQRGVNENAERISRHWFDLVSLRLSNLGASAVVNIELMRDVVALKKVFFNSVDSNYDLCLKGEFSLVPDEANLMVLKRDYSHMVRSGFLYSGAMEFGEVMKHIQSIQDEINALIIL